MVWWKLVLGLMASVAVVAALTWLVDGDEPRSNGMAAIGAGNAGELQPLRLGLVPEQDIFHQRRQYTLLAEYLAQRLDRPIELVTLSTYNGVLLDFEQQQVDAAFLGSLVTVLVHDLYGAQILVKPRFSDGTSTYWGVVFVREDSPIRSLDELQDGCLAMVRATMAAHLFPMALLQEHGLLDSDHGPRHCWIASHDEVIAATAEGRVMAGAAKNRRIDAFTAANPHVRLRRLAEGGQVPENALVASDALDAALVDRLRNVMLAMHGDPAAAAVLEALGLDGFVPCDIEEYQLVYETIDLLRPRWPQLEIVVQPLLGGR